MKVIHFDSGLGNQISIYAEYLAMKHANPNDDIYMEDIAYSIPEVEAYLSMWQGYELKKVFGINIHNISELFSDSEYDDIIKEVKETEFWKYDWNYPNAIVSVLSNHGLELKNMCKSNFIFNEGKVHSMIRYFLKKCRRTEIGGILIRNAMSLFESNIIESESYYKDLYYSTEENIFFGQTGYPLYKSAKIEIIEKQLRNDLKFNVILTGVNKRILEKIESSNSIAVHARRGDLLKYVDYCYLNGYFLRATKYIKKKVENPFFFIFSDENSKEWILDNLNILGLSSKDQFCIIDWNDNDNSYIDMYLMSKCKHNIFTKSSFGFWAAWLNDNKEKITCSPDVRINSTHTF